MTVELLPYVVAKDSFGCLFEFEVWNTQYGVYVHFHFCVCTNHTAHIVKYISYNKDLQKAEAAFFTEKNEEETREKERERERESERAKVKWSYMQQMCTFVVMCMCV